MDLGWELGVAAAAASVMGLAHCAMRAKVGCGREPADSLTKAQSGGQN